jgi:hypothetical protein
VARADKNASSQLPEIDVSKASDLINSMATIVHNSIRRYWLSKSDSDQAISVCFDLLLGLLETGVELSFEIVNGNFVLNGKPVFKEQILQVQEFVDHLTALKINNFSLSRGISLQEYSRLFEIVEMYEDQIEEAGGFRAVLAKSNLEHVKSKHIVFKAISEEEVVVSKKDAVVKGGAAAGMEVDEATGATILAFLRGDVSVKDEKIVEKVHETAADPEKMAALILQAAEIQQGAASGEGGASLSGFVVGCLRNAYSGMAADRSARTKAGKKRIAKNLLLLEEELINKMQEMSSELEEDAIEIIATAREEMTDELRIDEIADEYVTKRLAVNESEERILKFIRLQGVDRLEDIGLKEKLAGRGLTEAGWQELMLKSGSAGQGGEDEGGADQALSQTMSRLSLVLKELEARRNVGESDGSTEAENEVKRLAGEARRTIVELADQLRTDEELIGTLEEEAKKSGRELVSSRSQMLATVAEIVRRISEPLNLVKSCLDAVASKATPELRDEQLEAEALGVALENLKMVKSMIDGINKFLGQ